MKVSVWIGSSPSWEVLDNYLTFKFTEDGDAIPCRFGDAFGINWFDEDYREASVSQKPTLLINELLSRHSNGGAISDALAKNHLLSEPCNAVVLLFEFEYSGKVKSAQMNDTYLCFIGCVEILV